jgi:hypothetical protein
MSQKKIHLNNRKLRRELGKTIPLHIWYQVTTKRLRRFPWSWFNRVFPIYPRPRGKVLSFLADCREWVRVVKRKPKPYLPWSSSPKERKPGVTRYN